MLANFSGRRRAEKRVRLGLLFLAAAAFFPGIWALFAPRSFFRDFPGFGISWIQSFPRYNEHLIQDVGGFYVGFGALLLAAAVIMDRRLTQVALIAWLAFDIPHFILHLVDSDLSRWSDLTQAVAIGVTVLIPAILIPLSRRAEKRMG